MSTSSTCLLVSYASGSFTVILPSSSITIAGSSATDAGGSVVILRTPNGCKSSGTPVSVSLGTSGEGTGRSAGLNSITWDDPKSTLRGARSLPPSGISTITPSYPFSSKNLLNWVNLPSRRSISCSAVIALGIIELGPTVPPASTAAS